MIQVAISSKAPSTLPHGVRVSRSNTQRTSVWWGEIVNVAQRVARKSMEDQPEANYTQPEYPLDLGARVPYELPKPCEVVDYGLRCGRIEGYIEVRPFQSSYHYTLRCGNGHYCKHVGHAEVTLALGLPSTVGNASSRDALRPQRRVAFNVLIRDNQACVYCGRRLGDLGADGRPVTIDADHLIPRDLIDYGEIKRDRDLITMARDLQLVTACRSDNSAKGTMLMPLEKATEFFIRHVLKGQTKGPNLGLLSTFERLYRLAERNARKQAGGS